MFAGAGMDLLVCYVGAHATSSEVLPVLVLTLQPCKALDYDNTDTAEWLANCSACCVPEIANAFTRSRVKFRVVFGTLHDDRNAWKQIEDWCRAAAVVRALRTARVGFLRHTYPGMLNMYSDFTMVTAQTGAHIEVCEMCDLEEGVEDVLRAEILQKLPIDGVRVVWPVAEQRPPISPATQLLAL